MSENAILSSPEVSAGFAEVMYCLIGLFCKRPIRMPAATAMSKSSKQGQGKKAQSNQVAVDEAPAASGTAPGVKLTVKAKGQSCLAKRKAEVLFYFILLIDYSFFLLAAPSCRG